MNRTTTPTPTPDKKRASPVPTDETLAIRALRDLRKLDRRLATAEQEVSDLKYARADYVNGLSDETKRILCALQGAK